MTDKQISDLTAVSSVNLTDEIPVVQTEDDSDNPKKATVSQIKTGLALAKADVGLGNVDNTSDANKPVSTATQTALDAKAAAADLTAHIGNTSNPHSVTKAQVGLGSVPNIDTTNDYRPGSTDVAVADGGTGASTAAAARTNLDVYSTTQVDSAISTAVTGLLEFKGSTDASANPNYPAASKGDAYVVSVAGKVGGASGKSVDVGDVYLATADNAGGSEASVGTSWTVLEHNLVGALLASNNLSDLANAATARGNLGLGTMATQAASGVAITGGSVTSITDLAVADGGTGASTASAARTNLGLAIGTDVEAHDADLTAIAALAPTNDDVLQRKAGAWTNRTPAQVKTDLALTKSDVGLGNVANVDTTDASNISSGTLDEARLPESTSQLLEGAGVNLTTSAGSTTIDVIMDVQEYTTTGDHTWTKPANALMVEVLLVGAGGGGASGYRNAEGNDRFGGPGGGAGGIVPAKFDAADLGATVTVTVGAGGTGGAAKTTNGSGNNGTNGGDTKFGTLATGGGGAAGLNSGLFPNTAGAAGASAYSNSAGAPSSLTLATAFSQSSAAYASGGGGGLARTAANAQAGGGAAGAASAGAGGTFGTAANGGAGTSGTNGIGASGGGGGGQAKAGGAGGTPGGGGGGGGAGNAGASENGGAGGNGGDGYARVITYIAAQA